MSLETGQEEEFGAVCPYLGLADDADSHATYPTDAHRCYRLPNPTRIATHHQETYCLVANHVNCPVYIGDEVPGVTHAASTPAPQPVTPSSVPPVGRSRPRRPPGSTDSGIPRPRRSAGGTIGPRPRSGGISMPVATIGLFALAVVVLAIAFGITQLTNGNNNNTTLPLSGNTATTTTTVAAGGTATVPAEGTATGSVTAPAGTATTTTGSGGGSTYTVQDGDTCYGIAVANGISLDALEAANGGSGPDGKCQNLNIDDVLTIPAP